MFEYFVYFIGFVVILAVSLVILGIVVLGTAIINTTPWWAYIIAGLLLIGIAKMLRG